jgi:hypothetical protein
MATQLLQAFGNKTEKLWKALWLFFEENSECSTTHKTDK